MDLATKEIELVVKVRAAPRMAPPRRANHPAWQATQYPASWSGALAALREHPARCHGRLLAAHGAERACADETLRRVFCVCVCPYLDQCLRMAERASHRVSAVLALAPRGWSGRESPSRISQDVATWDGLPG
jgi:hypothetical protein